MKQSWCAHDFKEIVDRWLSGEKKGEPMKLEMKYFVLKPKGHDLFARASRAAMKAYAEAIFESAGADEEALQFGLEINTWRKLEERRAMNGEDE